MTRDVDSPLSPPNPAERRSFFTRAAAVIVGGLVALFPFAVSIGVLFDPLRRKQGDGGADFVRIGPLDLLPADGVPRQFALSADVVDAWTRVNGRRVGSVFLRRMQSDDGPTVVALSSVCPHLGCAVDYAAGADRFECPCHESAFGKDGEKLFGPSLRGLDPLAVKIVDNHGQPEIWVELKRYRTGVAERVPVA